MFNIRYIKRCIQVCRKALSDMKFREELYKEARKLGKDWDGDTIIYDGVAYVFNERDDWVEKVKPEKKCFYWRDCSGNRYEFVSGIVFAYSKEEAMEILKQHGNVINEKIYPKELPDFVKYHVIFKNVDQGNTIHLGEQYDFILKESSAKGFTSAKG